jgi:hypothetical protein
LQSLQTCSSYATFAKLKAGLVLLQAKEFQIKRVNIFEVIGGSCGKEEQNSQKFTA